MREKNKTGVSLTKAVILMVFTCVLVLPLARMLLYIDGDVIKGVVNAPGFGTVLGNSVKASILATAVTLVLAYLLAVCVERTDIRGKKLLMIVLVLPMLIPSISHGMGLVILFGNNGLLTQLLGLSGSIYGMKGVVVGSVMYAFPVAFLMFVDVLRYQDCTPYQAATVLGLSRWDQFVAITLPYLRRPLISATLATFTMIITDYGVPLMVGGKYKTLPVTLYQEVIGQLNFAKGSVYGLILLIPAVTYFIFDACSGDKGNSATVTDRQIQSVGWLGRYVAYLICGGAGLFAVTPVAAFLLLGFSRKYPTDLTFSLSNVEKTLGLRAGVYLGNSVMIALFAALVGVIVCFVTAYLTARMNSKRTKLLHLLAITSAAVPGVVLGLSYILVFKGTALYGTMAVLIIVNTVHFFATPYLMMYNSLSKLNENLESIGETLGVGRLSILRDVILPQSRTTIAESFSYFFVNSMITISAVAFLATTANKPIALMINQFEAQMQLASAAVVSLAILGVNLAVKSLVALLVQATQR